MGFAPGPLIRRYSLADMGCSEQPVPIQSCSTNHKASDLLDSLPSSRDKDIALVDMTSHL